MSASLSGPTRPITRRPHRGPDPERFARLLVQVWLEVRSGRRPFAQLAPLVAPALRRRLLARLPRVPHPREVPPSVAIRKVVVSAPSESAYEMCVLIEHGGRVTAVALRIERHHAAWRAVEMTAPETGREPLVSEPPSRRTRSGDAFDAVLEGGGVAPSHQAP